MTRDSGTDRDFADFCARAHPRLVGALAHQLSDRWLAEELAQEALVRACDRWSQVRQLRDPTGWAFRVAVNLSRSQFRRRRAERRARQRHGPGTAVHVDPDTADRLTVTAALRELTDRQREMVVLRYFLRLTVEETAILTGATPGAVRALTHRALAALRAELGAAVVVEEARDVR